MKHPLSDSDLSLSYTAEHRIGRVRFLMYLSAACILLATLPYLQLLEMLKTGTEPNGDPIAAAEALALLAICQPAGWSFLIGMHRYGRC
ncbi:MAG: hypothetical protein ACI8Y8_004413 [Planctomycetota bacterium]|jgi:hypothetical protein